MIHMNNPYPNQPLQQSFIPLDERLKNLSPGKKAALAIGGCVAALAVIAGLSGGGSHSDSWHLGYENSQTAKSLVKAGVDPRAACRGSLTIPSSYNYDDVIDGCIAAVS